MNPQGSQIPLALSGLACVCPLTLISWPLLPEGPEITSSHG